MQGSGTSLGNTGYYLEKTSKGITYTKRCCISRLQFLLLQCEANSRGDKDQVPHFLLTKYRTRPTSADLCVCRFLRQRYSANVTHIAANKFGRQLIWLGEEFSQDVLGFTDIMPEWNSTSVLLIQLLLLLSPTLTPFWGHSDFLFSKKADSFLGLADRSGSGINPEFVPTDYYGRGLCTSSPHQRRVKSKNPTMLVKRRSEKTSRKWIDFPISDSPGITIDPVDSERLILLAIRNVSLRACLSALCNAQATFQRLYVSNLSSGNGLRKKMESLWRLLGLWNSFQNALPFRPMASRCERVSQLSLTGNFGSSNLDCSKMGLPVETYVRCHSDFAIGCRVWGIGLTSLNKKHSAYGTIPPLSISLQKRMPRRDCSMGSPPPRI
ncbi:hypothetical protein Tco_0516299 [Tanacetum coccineum]